jgi:hypothetical protein
VDLFFSFLTGNHLAVKAILLCFALLHIAIAPLCAQSDSLTQILDDIQDDDVSLNNWLEVISDQFLERNQSLEGKYPKISIIHRFQHTLEKNEALIRKIFVGSPFESYTRVKASLYSNLSVGVLSQKDVGELDFTDHYSGYISWNLSKFPLKIIFGNFFIRSGEGLLLSGPFSLPKTAYIKSPSMKKCLQARPFLSANEYDGFWGGAIEMGSSISWKLVLFYSRIFRDGILSDDKMLVTGFERSGYHRTFTERSRANRIREKTYGGAFSFPLFFLDQIGLNFVKTHYFPEISAILTPQERRRNYYKYHGLTVENYSLYFAENFHTFRLSGEIFPLKSKKIAHITSLNFESPEWHIVLKSWNIPVQMQSPFGRIPSDSNPFPQAVNGFMLGTMLNPIGDFKITSFWSLKKDLWRSYFQPLPVQKKEFYLKGEYKLGSKSYIYLRYQATSSGFYSSDYRWKIEKVKQGLRVQTQQGFGTHVRFQTRIEKVFIRYFSFYPSKTGLNFYQDIYWKFIKIIAFRFRFSSFSTSDYDSRLYEYENDLPHVFSNYALYGRGRKWYIMITANPSPQIRLWLKYRRITFDSVVSIGSGMMTIGGDMRQDVHLQVELRY